MCVCVCVLSNVLCVCVQYVMVCLCVCVCVCCCQEDVLLPPETPPSVILPLSFSLYLSFFLSLYLFLSLPFHSPDCGGPAVVGNGGAGRQADYKVTVNKPFKLHRGKIAGCVCVCACVRSEERRVGKECRS